MVPKAGIEPARPERLWILNPARLPVPPLRHGYCLSTRLILTYRVSYGKRFRKKNLNFKDVDQLNKIRTSASSSKIVIVLFWMCKISCSQRVFSSLNRDGLETFKCSDHSFFV